MKRVFGAKKNKDPPPSIEDASDRITKRGDNVDEKIKKLDAELSRYKEQIKKTRPGPAQEAVKARAMRVLKQKRMYEGQRDMLYNQTFNLDQVHFAAEGIKDAQQTMTALKSANKELKGMMKTVKIQDIDNLQDEMMDLMDVSNEIQETLGRSYNVPDDIDEEDLMGELDALEADMENETEANGVPSYLQPESDLDAEIWKMSEELEASKGNEEKLNEKLKNVEKEKEGLESEMKKLRVQTEQWRKAADAAAAVLSGEYDNNNNNNNNNNMNGKIPERCGSMDKQFETPVVGRYNNGYM